MKLGNHQESILGTANGRLAAFLAVAVAPSIACSQAYAQEGPSAVEPASIPVESPAEAPLSPDSGKPASASRLIEEIVVTAQKREENVQDVPISISAFSAEQLDARGAVSTKDLGTITPGLQFTELAGYTLIFLRGVGSDAFIPSADPSVATYIDGVFMPSGQGFATSMGGVQRVEVLKGPQGTLFGRNSTGGAISVILKEPNQTPETSIQASLARFDDAKARVYTNIPLTDSLAVSIAGLYSRVDSLYIHDNPNPNDNQPFPDEVNRAARLKMHWDLTESLALSVTGEIDSNSGAGSLISAVETPSPLLSALGGRAEQDEYHSDVDTYPSAKATHRKLYGNLNWNGPVFDSKLILSTQKLHNSFSQYDFDASDRPLVSFYSTNQFTDQDTYELQILSNEDTWGAERFKWVAGLYRFESVAGYDPIHLDVAASVAQLPTGDIVSLIPPGLTDILGFIPGPSGIDAIIFGLLGTTSNSAYFQGTYTATDWLGVTFGGRYQEEKRHLVKSSVALDNIGGNQTNVIQFDPDPAKVTNFSPKLSLEFRFWENVLIYASATRGFKSGTFNIVNLYTPPDYVKPEKVTALEVGTKTTLFDGSVRLNSAVFQTTIDDFQSTFVSLLAGGAVNFENAGKARIRGAEFDLTWLPLQNIDPGFVITGGASYLDAKFLSFKNASGFDETTGLYRDNYDFSGNRITRTPKFTANVGISQSIEVFNGTLELGGDVYFNSGYFYTSQNSPLSEEPSYQVLNARISYLYRPWGTRITVFGNNITDTRYSYAKFHTDFGVANTLAQPDTYGVRVSWDF